MFPAAQGCDCGGEAVRVGQQHHGGFELQKTLNIYLRAPRESECLLVQCCQRDRYRKAPYASAGDSTAEMG